MTRLLCGALCAWALAGCYGEVPWPDAPTAPEASEPAAFVDAAWPDDIDRPQVAVMTRLGFAREEPLGVAPGFDVDGRVSDGDDPAGCYWEDLESPEGQDGVDNQFATLVPALEVAGGGVVEDFIQTAIHDGSILVMLILEGLDDPVDDDHLVITMTSGVGKPLVGTDGYLVPGQTFALDPDAAVSVMDASLTGGEITAGPFDGSLPVVVFGIQYVLELRDAWITFELTAEGDLRDGLFGGGITVDSLVEVAELSGDKDVIGLFGPLIPNAADLAPGPDGVCTQVSAALSFDGAGAFVHDPDE